MLSNDGAHLLQLLLQLLHVRILSTAGFASGPDCMVMLVIKAADHKVPAPVKFLPVITNLSSLLPLAIARMAHLWLGFPVKSKRWRSKALQPSIAAPMTRIGDRVFPSL